MGGVKLADVRLTSYGPGVYEPSEDSFALADAIAGNLECIMENPPALCLEVGVGSGYVISSLALMLEEVGCRAQFLATDLSSKAAEACRETLAAHQVRSVDVIRVDLVSALLPRLRNNVDVLVFNPPYVPTPTGEIPSSQWKYDEDGCSISAAWAGGIRGREVVDRLLPLVNDILSPTGHFFLVTVQENDHEEILSQLTSTGLFGRVAMQQSADEELLRVLHFSRHPFRDDKAGSTATCVHRS